MLNNVIAETSVHVQPWVGLLGLRCNLVQIMSPATNEAPWWGLQVGQLAEVPGYKQPPSPSAEKPYCSSRWHQRAQWRDRVG